jgi:3,4-dihydroxy 2-butanone 4-phosphate synthase/GTP cyclohydrolase II
MNERHKFNSIEQAIKDIASGRMVIVVDDKDRENEGDLVMAAERTTPAAVNFMITHGKGLVCLPMLAERLDELKLSQMVEHNMEHLRTAFTVSVDAAGAHGIATGISPADRAKTVKVMIAPDTNCADIVSPGHVFPLRAMEGGVLRRAGHTEAAVDLSRLAGLYPAGVICEIIKDDGNMARVPDLVKFAARHELKMITISDLISYRLKKDKLVRRVTTASMPTKYGDFKVHGYYDILTGETHVALVKGSIKPGKPTLVRVHSQCLTGDVFGSLRCDCGEQLDASLRMISGAGCGILLYMRQEGRGIGLINKLKAYELQDKGKDTVEANEALGFPADLRDYGIGAQILADLGDTDLKLVTNNPRKIVGLEGYGLSVVSRIPIEVAPNRHNLKYLRTKSRKLGHILNKLYLIGKRRGNKKCEKLSRAI